MKKIYYIAFLFMVLPWYQPMRSEGHDVPADQVESVARATAVDVRALDELIDAPDFPEPDPENLQVPTWKIWLVKAADTMIWTVNTGKDAVMAAYDRCKGLISSGEQDDEVES